MTTVQIRSRAWHPSYSTEPNEKGEQDIVAQNFHVVEVAISGPGGDYQGGQKIEGLAEDAPDEAIVDALKALWGGQDDWTLKTE